MEFTEQDKKFMKLAIRLGSKGLGRTEPNPMVGAVVVKNGRVISTGYHARPGGKHAERLALEKVGEPGTTLYVPLEPCSHFGRTPPCTDIVISKGVARVVTACQDPDPRVNGRGFAALESAGIQIACGCLEDIYRYVNRHYFTRIEKRRPYIMLKAGVSVDGKLTDREGRSQWITSERMRRLSHQMRAEFSAIMAGSATVRQDNPGLNLRDDAWKDKGLFRVVLDSANSLDCNLNVFSDQERFPLIIFSSDTARNKEPKAARHYFIKENSRGLSLDLIMKKLNELEIASIMVEGGGRLINSFLETGLWDELIFFTADKLIGGRNSVQLFAEGRPVGRAVTIKNRKITELEEGFLVRGFN